MVPNSKYKVDTITYSDTSDITFENNKLVIANISDDVVVDVKFKEEKTSVNKPEIIPITKPETSPVPDDDKNNSIENSGNNIEKFEVFNYGKGQILINIPKLNEFEFVTIPNTRAFIESVFTQEELKEIVEGKVMELHFIPTIYEKVEQVPIKDKLLIDRFIQENSQKRNNLMVGVYINIKLYKVTSNGDKINVTKTEKPIEIVLEIPEDINFEGSKYSVVCSHEGQIIQLQDLDNNENTITIDPQHFSTFAIIYSISGNNLEYTIWILGISISLGTIVCFVWKRQHIK